MLKSREKVELKDILIVLIEMIENNESSISSQFSVHLAIITSWT